ncbi:AMP-binding protein [Actinomadura hibisca]|uniref:AMP-binding protein n=1 Tax=Actinomadura hibisca TaxID=68565 RepID=UPI00082C4A73|nr:AMP-binding protein [Actinomadura hibisca]
MSEPRDLFAWFDRAAAAHPRAVALVADGHEMTYDRLAAAVADAAEHLARSLPPAARVGVLATRTADAYVAYLAVLRAGRTVVPLHPSFPAARTLQTLDSASVHAVVGDPGGLERLRLPWRDAGRLPGTSWPLRVDPARPAPAGDDAPAYVLFTSGTTGKPKGIPIGHANVSAYLERFAAVRPVGPGERASQCFDLTFDPSVSDMFATWGAGATLVVPTGDQLRDPVAFVNDFGVDHWSSVPSVASLARRMRRLSPGAMPRLRTACFAGEALTLSQARAWRAAAPGCRVWNAYGPTEVTITCSAYRLPDNVADWPETRNGTVPIGTPYPDVRWRIEPAADPSESSGELWLAGPQRFAGYLDPADNTGRFSPGAPSGRAPDAEAFYRTGDNVADTPDGLLHLGRLDQQVQVNGYRVELSEVEGALRGHPAVDEAVAFLADGELVAVHTGTPGETGTILDAVARRLPPYMVPSRIWHEPSLPLNANGKIDRRVLQTR